MIAKFYSVVYYLLYYPYYKILLKQIGKRTRIFAPLKIQGSKNIVLGKKVTIEYKTWLAAVPLTNAGECILEIRDGATIGHFNHIYATHKITIDKNVLTADKVYISDNLHEYENINIPIIKQPIKQLSEVFIGEGTWLGENVCVIGAKIGKQCVIGANAVVTKDIPDYCVAVGAPAIIIKRYNPTENKWIKTNADGDFI